jgi:hypothetical protein
MCCCAAAEPMAQMQERCNAASALTILKLHGVELSGYLELAKGWTKLSWPGASNRRLLTIQGLSLSH